MNEEEQKSGGAREIDKRNIPLTVGPLKGSRWILDILPRRPRFTKGLAMKNTADVTGGKPIAV
jgi:hypothetical protein